MNKPLAVAVVGAGSWGTALAQLMAVNGHRVRLWAFEPEVAESINRERMNPLFLPGIPLTEGLAASNELAECLEGAELVLLVMPSHVFRQVLGQVSEHLPESPYLTLCSKGIEEKTGYTMLEIAQEVLPNRHLRRITCLSGPSFAREVARGRPSAVTVACRDIDSAVAVQAAFASTMFRVYTSADVMGVELGGACKNPLAIAAGMVAGLKLGHNTLAAMITRGLAEMTRLALARGAQMTTMSGLAGLGDLVLTCTSDQSRNYTVGFKLGQGQNIEEITGSTRSVAEGVINTRTIRDLARRARVDMPITEVVYKVIYQGMSPEQALVSLMSRDLKHEED